MRMPHTTITKETQFSERQERFMKDRLSSIHVTKEQKYGGYVRKVNQKEYLEEVKEEQRESESRLMNHNQDGEGDETEIVAIEIEDSDEIEKYGKDT